MKHYLTDLSHALAVAWRCAVAEFHLSRYRAKKRRAINGLPF